jgi:hypothetical protein
VYRLRAGSSCQPKIRQGAGGRKKIEWQPQRRVSSSGSLAMFNRDPPSFIAGEKLGCGSPAGLVLAIDVAQCLSVTVTDDEARGRLFDGPRVTESGAATSRSANHLIGTEDKGLGKTDAECISSLEIKNQLEFRWLLDRKISRFCTF